ncbi:zinc-binding metallopeptidase family protein [Arthrobacter pigmenti]
MSAPELTSELMTAYEPRLPDLVELYKDLHAHPELSMAEHRTATVVAERLREAGLKVTENVGGTGVVGVLDNGPGKTVLLRGDMDGLPIAEETGLPHASRHTAYTDDGDQPTMHACGHDVHTTCLIGTAELLAAHRDRWSGTLVICAQPGEETAEGARAMLADGLMTRFPRPDVCLGQHVGPAREGLVQHKAGVLMSAAVNVQVTIFGRGGHASTPEATIDPVLTGAHLVTRLQSVISREIPASDAAVLSVTMFQAGTKANIIPNQATLTMNIRVRSDSRKHQVLDAIRRIADAECAAAGCEQPPAIETFSDFPVTVNDDDVVERVRQVHTAPEGESVMDAHTLMGSEDFSEFGIPGENRYDGPPIPYAYWFIGITDPAVWDAAPGSSLTEKMSKVPANHTDQFAPRAPERTVPLGVRLLTSAALSYLAEESPATSASSS